MSNIGDYEYNYSNFDWGKVNKNFTWYTSGKVNAAYEAIDKHVENGLHEKKALIYSSVNRQEEYTFGQMKTYSNRAGNVLKSIGVQKGDRVFLFMPRIPELYFSFLGAIKIGAIVGPLFEAFKEGALLDRLSDSGATVLITTKELLPNVPVLKLPNIKIIVLEDSSEQKEPSSPFLSYINLMDEAHTELDIEWMDLEDPMLIHYTSGSTGKPKGIVHSHRAMIQHFQTGKWVLDLSINDIYWCTADPGWVTGTSYGIFAPWLNGVTNVVRGGRFSPKEWYQTLEDNKVTVWYSAPTAFRMLMNSGIEDNHDFSSLKHVLSVGEPLNPEVIRWGEHAYGKQIHDTWWMTETGAILISNLPGMNIKPGSMGKPFPGIKATILDDDGKELGPNQMGNLAISSPWPSIMNSVWKNSTKYNEYFTKDNWYVSGDSAYKDEDGYFWFQGRIDDVINTAGERVGPFEVESSLIEHPDVVEAGVIGKPDTTRGEIIKAFVVLKDGVEPTQKLKIDLQQFVKKKLAAHSYPREIEFIDLLPKTRSGKIMRRILKSKELGLDYGDISTLEA